MALLLGSRGRTRQRSGLGKLVRSIRETWFGRSQWRDERPSRGMQVQGWAAAAALLAAFAGGYLVGGRFGGGVEGGSGLQAKAPTAAGFLGEFDAKPISSNAFIVAVYPDLAVPEAKRRAKLLADWLVSKELAKARPYEYPTREGPLWVVAVYYDGDAELQATRDRLSQLPEAVPDESFVYLRNTEAGWPKAWAIR